MLKVMPRQFSYGPDCCVTLLIYSIDSPFYFSCTCEDGGSVNCLHDKKGCPRPFPSRLPSDNCTLIQQLYKACVDVNWKERICKRFIRLSFWFARKTKCLTDEEITNLKSKKRKTICRDPSGQKRKTGDTWTKKQFWLVTNTI